MVRQRALGAVRLQGWYYLLGGLWPFLHFSSFEAVAGPKPDRFQTEVTAALFTATGAALLAGSRRGGLAPATRVLAAGAALAVAYVDWRHRKDIRVIFGGEAAMETAFAVAAVAAPSVTPAAAGAGRS